MAIPPKTPKKKPSRVPTKADLDKTFYSKVDDFDSRVIISRGESTSYRARCVVSGGSVILQGYSQRLLTDKNKRRIINEIRISRHMLRRVPHVVRCFDSFEDHGIWFAVFENCAGGDLGRIVDRNGGTIQSEGWLVSKVITPLLYTLAQMHQENILHRDVRPEHIYFTSHGFMKLGGFYISHDAKRDGFPDEYCGHLDYVAPEVILMENPEVKRAMGGCYNTKVDIWAVGCLVHDVLLGEPPFKSDDPLKTIQKVILFDPKMKGAEVDMSADARDFVRAALRKLPASRPSAFDLLNHPWIQRQMEWTPPPGFVDPLTSAPPPHLGSPTLISSAPAKTGRGAGGGRSGAHGASPPHTSLTEKIRRFITCAQFRSVSPVNLATGFSQSFAMTQMKNLKTMRKDKDKQQREASVTTNKELVANHLQCHSTTLFEHLDSDDSEAYFAQFTREDSLQTAELQREWTRKQAAEQGNQAPDGSVIRRATSEEAEAPTYTYAASNCGSRELSCEAEAPPAAAATLQEFHCGPTPSEIALKTPRAMLGHNSPPSGAGADLSGGGAACEQRRTNLSGSHQCLDPADETTSIPNLSASSVLEKRSAGRPIPLEGSSCRARSQARAGPRIDLVDLFSD